MNKIKQHTNNCQMTVMKSCEAFFNHLQHLQAVEEKKQRSGISGRLLLDERTFNGSIAVKEGSAKD